MLKMIELKCALEITVFQHWLNIELRHPLLIGSSYPKTLDHLLYIGITIHHPLKIAEIRPCGDDSWWFPHRFRATHLFLWNLGMLRLIFGCDPYGKKHGNIKKPRSRKKNNHQTTIMWKNHLRITLYIYIYGINILYKAEYQKIILYLTHFNTILNKHEQIPMDGFQGKS